MFIKTLSKKMKNLIFMDFNHVIYTYFKDYKKEYQFC